MTPSISRRGFIVPLLYAVLPALFIADANPGHFTLIDLGIVLTACSTVCAVFYALAAIGLRTVSVGQLAPLATLMLVGWFFLYRAVQQLVSNGLGVLGAHYILIPFGIAVGGGVLWLLARRPPLSLRLTRALTRVGVALVLWSILGIAVDEIQAVRAIERSGLRRSLLQPVVNAKSASVATANQPPDVYLILLDERANSEVMRERFEFHGRVFEDSLRQLGFTIPRLVQSNYVHTTLSLVSLLSFTHLGRLSDELGAEEIDPSLPDELLQENRVARFLRSRGYQFVFFPSQWWPSTRHMRNADENIEVWPTSTLSRGLTRSDLRRNLRKLTPLWYTSLGDGSEYADYVRRTFEGLKNLPVTDRPRFVFAHILSPHPPVALDSHCRAVNGPDLVRANHPLTMAAYRDQVRCIDSLVLDLARALLTRSRRRPIILVQGDHGTSSLNYSGAPTAAEVSGTQARERFGAFGAYFLPHSNGRLLADTVTLVNVFPSILNSYFGTELPLEANELYMSLERSPYAFRRTELDGDGTPSGSSSGPGRR